MRPLTPPTETVLDTFEPNIQRSTKRNTLVVQALKDLVPAVATAERQFLRLAASSDYHLMPRIRPPELGTCSMSVFYDSRLAGRPEQTIYSAIRLSSRTCPSCGAGRVKQVDHYLPKDVYPLLAATPSNLVPVCRDCNTTKANYAPTNQNEAVIHPYFDHFHAERWLYADVVEAFGVPVLEFHFVPPPTWSPTEVSRVRKHVQVYQLSDLYASSAVDVMEDYALRFSELHETGGGPAIAQWASDEARTILDNKPNSPEGVTFEAISLSPWFCAGGFALL